DEEDAPARNRGAAEDRLGDAGRLARVVVLRGRHLDFAEDLRPAAGRLDDEELAALGPDIELAVGEDERRLLNRPERLRPQDLAGLGVVGLQARAVLDLIEDAAVDHRRREAELVTLLRPQRGLD